MGTKEMRIVVWRAKRYVGQIGLPEGGTNTHKMIPVHKMASKIYCVEPTCK